MPIKVQWDTDGPYAICDTPAEAIELMRQARLPGKGTHKPVTEPKPEPQKVRQNGAVEDRIGALVGGINGKAQTVIRSLLDFPNGVESEEFSQACGIATAGLGGLLGSITKAAKNAHVKVTDVVQSEFRVDGKRRFKWYTPGKILMENKERFQFQ
jgi:hypothetical protein